MSSFSPGRPSIFALPEQLAGTQHDFDRASRLLKARAGIVLGAHKQEAALRTLSMRAQALQFADIGGYLDLLEHQSQHVEWEHFINAFTINHTAFFREQHHFKVLADLVRSRRKALSVWCCAASTGEEPYSIAMTLREAGHPDGMVPPIVASDIDTRAVERAAEGVYTLERVAPVPDDYLRKYFQRGTGNRAGMVRVKSVIRDMVQFQIVNLLEPQWPSDRRFDVIFCRNTMIYFDKPTQTRILERFARTMNPGGLLFAGHSENFTYLTKAFRLQGQTVYVLA